MDANAIVTALHELQLPNPDGVIIVSGAAMAMTGLRLANDIDLMVDEENWHHLTALKGWREQWLDENQPRAINSTRMFDVWRCWVDKRTDPWTFIDFKEIWQQTYSDKSGYRVPTIECQILMKQQLVRTKDEPDIARLQSVLT